MAKDVRRPILITLLGVLYILSAVILFLLAGAIIVMGSADPSEIFSGDTLDQILKFLTDNNLTWSQFTTAGGVVMAVVALITLIIGIGFLKGWSIFWYLGVIFNILTIVGVIYTIVTTQIIQGVAGAVISFLFLLYLFLPGVKRFFLTK